MANSRQQLKRAHTNEKRNLRNNMFTSSLRRSITQVKNYVEAGEKEKALDAFNTANKKLDKSLAKGINHKNKVARQKSQLQKMINSL